MDNFYLYKRVNSERRHMIDKLLQIYRAALPQRMTELLTLTDETEEGCGKDGRKAMALQISTEQRLAEK